MFWCSQHERKVLCDLFQYIFALGANISLSKAYGRQGVDTDVCEFLYDCLFFQSPAGSEQRGKKIVGRHCVELGGGSNREPLRCKPLGCEPLRCEQIVLRKRVGEGCKSQVGIQFHEKHLNVNESINL